jgi:hypothetical protein
MKYKRNERWIILASTIIQKSVLLKGKKREVKTANASQR